MLIPLEWNKYEEEEHFIQNINSQWGQISTLPLSHISKNIVKYIRNIIIYVLYI